MPSRCSCLNILGILSDAVRSTPPRRFCGNSKILIKIFQNFTILSISPWRLAGVSSSWGAHRLPLRESAARAGRGVLVGLAGRALWLEAPAPRITRLGAYRLGGVAELDGAARDATPVAWCCRNNRAASGRVGEPPWLSDPPVLLPPTTVMGGGGAPKRYQPHGTTLPAD